MVDEEAARAGAPMPSPAPSDDDLWDVEEPFTMFGQYGVGAPDLRVFDQDAWWVDRLGRPHRLEAMSTEYRRSVLTFLLDLADRYWLGAVLSEAITALIDAVRGKVAYGALAEDAGAPSVFDLDPVTWLEGSPLMRRLRAWTPEGLADGLPEAGGS